MATPVAGDMTRQLSALCSPQGQDLLARLADEQAGPGTELLLQQRLRRDFPADLIAAALTQWRLRLAARAKFSRAAEMFFTPEGLEQASAEPVARRHAARQPPGGRLADLCCGIGGDLIALAAGREVLAVDRDPATLELAMHNAGVYGAADGVTAWNGDVRDCDLAGVDAVFIDPARRGSGRRLRPGLSEPPLGWCVALASQVAAVGIKAAPGLASDAIPAGWEAEFIADGRDLKEAVLWSPELARASRRATILPAGHTLLPHPGPPVPVAEPGAFLLDPNPAVTRAGLVEELARDLGAWKIDPRIAFLSSDADRRTPFARTLRVVESAPWNEKRFAQRLRALGVGAADIRRRGLAGDVDMIHRRLKLDGPRRAVVIMTRVDGRPWGMICSEPFLTW
jgi:SAM-dependent methyltransferase